jgi:hypothetical protein
MDGSSVAAKFYEGKYKDISDYCTKDVIAVYDVVNELQNTNGFKKESR